MKKALSILALILVFHLTGLASASGGSRHQSGTNKAWEPTSTCWLTCFSLSSGVAHYNTFNVTKSACCGGTALSCPPGSTPGGLAWGEPAMLCGPSTEF